MENPGSIQHDNTQLELGMRLSVTNRDKTIGGFHKKMPAIYMNANPDFIKVTSLCPIGSTNDALVS